VLARIHVQLGVDTLSTIEHTGFGLLTVLWGLSVLPAGLASFVLITMLGQRLSARMPGPRRDLRIERVILSWPDPTARAPWKIWLLWVALLCLITVPGATYAALSDDDGLRGVFRVVPLVVGGLAFYILATWVEWLARVAAIRRQPALVLLAPAALIGAYGIICRVIGPAPVDTILLHSLGFVLVLIIIFVVAAGFGLAGAFGLGVLFLGVRLLWWPFGRVVRWYAHAARRRA
jgi:hypothetical protein